MTDRSTASDLPAGPLLVHSDVLRVAGLVEGTTDRGLLLSRHLDVLRRFAAGRGVWMPTFNYDFTRSGLYDVRDAPSQVGVLSEHFRREVAAWRTETPVFSFAGTGEAPVESRSSRIDPFGGDSAFAELARRDGSVVFYGAPFPSATWIHHAERVAGGPAYRYDKFFSGQVVRADGTAREVTLVYHVRPLDRYLDYDWPRLVDDLRRESIIRDVIGHGVSALPARSFLRSWVERLEADPLYLLDDRTREWVAPELQRLGRRFELADFEVAG